jgi:hypothetical protein
MTWRKSGLISGHTVAVSYVRCDTRFLGGSIPMVTWPIHVGDFVRLEESKITEQWHDSDGERNFTTQYEIYRKLLLMVYSMLIYQVYRT